MRAVVWTSAHDVEVQNVPDPKILNPHDAIVQVTSTAICGSDIHLYDGYIPTMKKGDILGHEFMGKVVEVGPEVDNLNVGDRVVVPFPIACGKCFFCKRQLWSLCANTNPNAYLAENMFGVGGGAIYGYSHLTGGYAGGQAEYVRVPFANVGPMKVPDEMSDEQVLFLSDILPTGYMAAENCNIQPGDTVAVFGAGPVGQFAIQSALLLGAEQVIAIDRFPYRLEMAKRVSKATHVINYEEDEDVVERLKSLTGGLGPDSVIEAVGMEAHGLGVQYAVEKAAQAVKLETGRPIALRQAIMACRPAGTVSVAGVFGGAIDAFPMGALMNKGLTMKSGQTHVHKYMKPLLEQIRQGHFDPVGVITHRLVLDDAPNAYKMFKKKEDNCEKVVMKP